MDALTKREQEILHLIADEYTTKEIAYQLFLSTHTVISHRKNLLHKMEVKNVAGMVRKGFEKGLLQVVILLLLATSSLVATTSCMEETNPTVVYVKQGIQTIQNGETWKTAFSTLQDALSHVKQIASPSNPIEIWLAQGTYYPDEGNGFKQDAQDSSFYLINNVSILGGFSGDELLESERDWVQNSTILSGDIDQDNSYLNNSSNVIYNSASSSDPINNTAVLDGVIIEFGIADASVKSPVGGGLYSFFSYALIKNCWFRNNQAVIGGAVYQERNGSTFTNCIFTDNDASANLGDALYFNQNADSTELVNCTIYNNDMMSGKAISINNSRITLRNSIIWNSATSFADGSQTHVIENCIIQGGYLPGTNIITTYPSFIDTVDYNLRLSACSPAIDAGQAVDFEYDYFNNERLFFDATDIGAIEFQSQTIYVDIDADGSGNGKNWESAYNHLHDALIEADQCNDFPLEIWMADGSYYPDEGFGQVDDNRSSSFYLLKSVSIYGGFSGNESNKEERDLVNNETILSGDIDQNDDLPGGDTTNAYHVFFTPFTVLGLSDSTTVIDGVIIADGHADGPSFHDGRGGGINCQWCSPTISNCKFRDNHAESRGGGIFTGDHPMSLYNILFEDNESESTGGAIFVSGYSPIRVGSCHFVNNNAGLSGGAIYIDRLYNSSSYSEIYRSTFDSNLADFAGAVYVEGDLGIDSCVFIDNTGNNSTGAIRITEATSLTQISSCDFINNGGGHTGAIQIDGSPRIHACYFEKNRALVPNSNAGAIHVGSGRPQIVNSVFYDNYAYFNGGAIENSSNGNPRILNCTFYKNFSNFPGGAIINFAADSMTIANSIFWDNTINGNSTEVSSNIDTIYNCIIEGGLNQGVYTLVGTNVLDTMPEFVDTLESSIDLSLMSCSPAIDAGSNNYVVSNNDFKGDQRIHNATGVLTSSVDIGAYEFQGGYATDCGDCPDILVLDGDIETDTYFATQAIICSGTIRDGASILLFAQDSIVFRPQFDSGINTTLLTQIGDCDSE